RAFHLAGPDSDCTTAAPASAIIESSAGKANPNATGTPSLSSGVTLQQRSLIGRIGDCRSFHPRKGRELVRPIAALRQDLYDRNVAYAQRIGYQRPVAPPSHRLCAH